MPDEPPTEWQLKTLLLLIDDASDGDVDWLIRPNDNPGYPPAISFFMETRSRMNELLEYLDPLDPNHGEEET